MSGTKFNMSNPGVKRILQELKEMQSNPSDDYMSLPLEDNIFEWQFAIRGPPDSEFEGGIYHGRIQLPPEYPFKPPSFMLLTPSGRFETQTKICLSISQYHPEHWQPSWSVRTALVALIAFMPTKGNGAIGSLEFTKEERKALALKSVEAPPKFGSPERQKLIDEIHEEMLRRMCHAQAHQDSNSQATSEGGNESCKEMPESCDIIEIKPPSPPLKDEQVHEHPPHLEMATQPAGVAGPVVENNAEELVVVPNAAIATTPSPRATTRRQQASDDQFLTLLAIGLMVALVALLMKKFYYSFAWISFKQ